MPYVIRSAVNVRQPTQQQLQSPFWSFEPRVAGTPLHPGATLVLEDEVYGANANTIKAMAAHGLITVEGDSAPATIIEPPAVSKEADPMPSPEEIVAAVAQDNAKLVETKESPVAAKEEPVLERSSSKKSHKRG
jgi:hypothetical protein